MSSNTIKVDPCQGELGPEAPCKFWKICVQSTLDWFQSVKQKPIPDTTVSKKKDHRPTLLHGTSVENNWVALTNSRVYKISSESLCISLVCYVTLTCFPPYSDRSKCRRHSHSYFDHEKNVIPKWSPMQKCVRSSSRFLHLYVTCSHETRKKSGKNIFLICKNIKCLKFKF